MAESERIHEHVLSGKLYSYIKEKLFEKYGSDVDAGILKRLDEEWNAICIKKLESDYYNLMVLIEWLKKEGFPYTLGLGRCLITYLFDTTSPNPLPPHKYCKHCKKVYWCKSDIYKIDGFDIPEIERRDIKISDTMPKYGFCSCIHDDFEYDGHDLLWQIPLNQYRKCKTEIEVLLPKGTEDKVAGLFKIYSLDILSMARELLIGRMKLKFCLAEAGGDKNYYDNIVSASCVGKVLENWPGVTGIPFNSRLPVPDSFYSLLATYSFHYSTRLWNFRTEFMVRHLDLNPENLMCFQEDIYNLYIRHGFSSNDAYTAMLSLRYGFEPPFRISDIRLCDDYWKYHLLMATYIPRYILSKGEIVERIFYSIRRKNLC